MNLRSLALIAAVCLLFGAMPICAQTQGAQGEFDPQKPAGPGPTIPPAPNQQQPSPTPQARPHPKSRKVITNEDLEGQGSIFYPGSGGVDLSRVNDCDRNCYEQVRQAAGIPPSPGTQWKHALLEGIEKVRADEAWQGHLVELAAVKGRYCDLERDKNNEMARRADPANVTEVELKIDESYDRKFAMVQRQLISSLERGDELRGKYSGIVVPFLRMQEQRITSPSCMQLRIPSYDYGAGDPIDP